MPLHRGRIARDREVKAIMDLVREDLEVLKPPRPAPVVQRFRDSHHRVARLLAFGMTVTQVAEATGYSINRICQLKQVPAFQDLTASYRKGVVDDEYRKVVKEYYDLVAENKLKAERMVGDRLDIAEEEGELPPMRDLISISRREDRTTNIQMNFGDFGQQLERAMTQSNKVIDATPVRQQPTLPSQVDKSTPNVAGGQALLRRKYA